MNMWQFMSDSPILTFFITVIIAHNLAWVINRIIRHLNIRSAGWPSAPLMDADGDIVHPKEDDDED